MKYIENNKKVYDSLAQEYLEKMADYAESDKHILHPLVDYINESFFKPKFLELGPGTGLTLSLFEEFEYDTSGIELSSNLAEIARKVAKKSLIIEGDFVSYDFKSSTYDVIFAKAFIHLFSLEDVPVVLDKIKSLLSDNGFLYITTTVHDKSEEGFFEKEDYTKKEKRFRRKWAEQDLLKTMKENGFEIIDKSYFLEEKRKKNWIRLILKKSLD